MILKRNIPLHCSQTDMRGLGEIWLPTYYIHLLLSVSQEVDD